MRAAMLMLVVSAAACGADPSPAKTAADDASGDDSEESFVSDEPEETTEAPRKRSAKRAAEPIPTECAADGNGACTPPAAFVEKLCLSPDPNVALAMFQKSTPWKRAYLRRDMEAWYVNGVRQNPQKLKFGEEVIIIADRSQGPGGIQVSGSGSYDVYRWDGSCVSLMSDEVALKPPTTPEVAPIPWKLLDSSVQATLERDQRIVQGNEERRKACKELSEKGQQKCERAHLGVSRLIAEYVRSGGELPAPKNLP
jgi:hypothetical protein